MAIVEAIAVRRMVLVFIWSFPLLVIDTGKATGVPDEVFRGL
jgi:hypothetical protein